MRRPNIPRPKKCRWVGYWPHIKCFKPPGVPLSTLEQITLSVDEYEALRLADLLGLYQEEAAEQMNVSRQTFGRIITLARHKVARCLVEGKALIIEGGDFVMTDRVFQCGECGATWEVSQGAPRPQGCPQCGNPVIHRADKGAGMGPGTGRGPGGRGCGRGRGAGGGQGRRRQRGRRQGGRGGGP